MFVKLVLLVNSEMIYLFVTVKKGIIVTDNLIAKLANFLVLIVKIRLLVILVCKEKILI